MALIITAATLVFTFSSNNAYADEISLEFDGAVVDLPLPPTYTEKGVTFTHSSGGDIFDITADNELRFNGPDNILESESGTIDLISFGFSFHTVTPPPACFNPAGITVFSNNDGDMLVTDGPGPFEVNWKGITSVTFSLPAEFPGSRCLNEFVFTAHPDETIYVVSESGNGDDVGEGDIEHGSLASADPVSGDLTQIGEPISDQVESEDGDFFGLSGLAIDSTGRFLVTAVGESSSSVLLEINGNNGEIMDQIGFTMTSLVEGNPVRAIDLAFDGNDVLFGVGSVGFSGNNLFTIDTSDATVDVIGAIGGNTVQGIAFAPDGTLYGVTCDEGGNELITLDPDEPEVPTIITGDLNNCYQGLGIDSEGRIYGTTDSRDSIYLITPSPTSEELVAGSGNDLADVDFGTASPDEPPENIPGANNGGEGYEGPTLGEFDDGRLIVSDGFCFDQFCLDVTEYFNHLPIQQVNSGSTHTISMTAHCSSGSNRCNYASVGAAPPGTDINSVQWNVMLKRTGISNDWQVTKDDPNGMLGDVTGTVQIIDSSRIQYTFNIQFITPASIGTVDGNAEPPEDNMILVTEIRDSNGGVGRNIFNEGVFVNDIYAYPQVDASYLPSVKVAPLCLNEDPTDRNTCAFELVRQWTIKQAEEKLKEIYEQNNYKTD